jgi:effector-binding domain-containing protein
MSLEEPGIVHKRIEPTLAAVMRFHLMKRTEIPGVLQELAAALPDGVIAGPPFVHIQGFSSYTEGFAAEAGFPVTRPVENGRVSSRTVPALEVLSLTHQGPPETVRETKLKLYDFARPHALISDEFGREVYVGWPDPAGPVEAQFVIHNWNRLLANNLERVLGADGRVTVMEGAEVLGIESAGEERFAWAKGAMQRLDTLAGEEQKFDVVSSCAHVFPAELLEKLQRVYAGAIEQGAGPLAAVDAVLAFMETDPGWNETEHRREGRVIYQTKKPADPEAFAAATSDDERRAAACFCPIIRARLKEGMPLTYCYCGAGWFRQQWETATGRPVAMVEVVRSVLKGDLVCEFATHLAEDL